jgi:HD-like signal output (HDOD) protein
LIFKGEVSRFHPADILIFLSHLKSNGILSVIYQGRTLTVSLKDGLLVDAHSSRGDDKILRMLLNKQIIDQQQCNHLIQVKRETGMSINQILEEIKLVNTPEAKNVLVDGIKEVLLEFYMLEKGEFHFTDVMVDIGSEVAAFDCNAISLESVSYVDEWRDIEKNLFSLKSRMRPTEAVHQIANLSDLEKWIMALVSKDLTVNQVIQSAPYPSFHGLKTVENLFTRKLLELQPSAESRSDTVAEPVSDQLFFAFKRAFKKIVLTDDIRKKLSAVVTFCKSYFEQIVILTADELQILQCNVFKILENGGIQQTNIKKTMGRLDEDPGFHAVYRSGSGFFGKTYPINLLEGLIEIPENGECAIIPVGKQKNVSIILYVVTTEEQQGLNAFHYLELLSWLIASPAEDKSQTGQSVIPSGVVDASKNPGMKTQTTAEAPNRIELLINKIEDLPPLPSLVFQILELLSDPDYSTNELEELIGQDQSLVAKLIKVSNSALYGGAGDIGSLRQALTRLGTRTVKSLVLATSTRTFFSERQSRSRISSQLLWQHSVECGLAARRVARKVGYSDPDEAFVGGVLHDIGKLVILVKLPDEYRSIQKIKKSLDAGDLALEKELIGCDHTMIGDKLMEKWKMPARLRACVRMHHRFKEAADGDLLVPMVAYGNYLAHSFSSQAESGQMDTSIEVESLVARLQLSDEQEKTLREEIVEDFQNNNLFD